MRGFPAGAARRTVILALTIHGILQGPLATLLTGWRHSLAQWFPPNDFLLRRIGKKHLARVTMQLRHNLDPARWVMESLSYGLCGHYSAYAIEVAPRSDERGKTIIPSAQCQFGTLRA